MAKRLKNDFLRLFLCCHVLKRKWISVIGAGSRTSVFNLLHIPAVVMLTFGVTFSALYSVLLFMRNAHASFRADSATPSLTWREREERVFFWPALWNCMESRWFEHRFGDYKPKLRVFLFKTLFVFIRKAHVYKQKLSSINLPLHISW